MELSPEQRELLPSDEDVAFYREHGWYISKKIVPDGLIDEAKYGSERHFAGSATRRSQRSPATGNREMATAFVTANSSLFRTCSYASSSSIR